MNTGAILNRIRKLELASKAGADIGALVYLTGDEQDREAAIELQVGDATLARLVIDTSAQRDARPD